MKTNTKRWIHVSAALIALIVITFMGGGLYDTYGRWSAERTVSRALESFSRGAVPQDVQLRLEVPNPAQVVTALRSGFEVEAVDNILWSYRSFEVLVRMTDGSRLWCDLYHGPEWHLKCWPTRLPEHAV